MGLLDWLVLSLTLIIIVAYGVYKTQGSKDLKSYLLADNSANWWTIGLSVMATQASAITFLSTPGQAYHDGMGFVQFYFGLPIAMVVICLFFIPIYKRLKVFSAYEYLETRFDVKTRTLAAGLFLIQRGLAAGITIYAPAIVLSTVLGLSINTLIIIIGLLVILYTVSGGTKAVNVTQKFQMGVIFVGMVVAFMIIINKLPESVGFVDALKIAGASDRMNILDFSFNLENRYTIWTGLIGGSFLALSYFGTDQSQVQRYLSSKSVKEAQMGMIFNGFLKVPMQFFILLTGIMVFVFYQFNTAPIFFNQSVLDDLKQTDGQVEVVALESELASLHATRTKQILSQSNLNGLGELNAKEKDLRTQFKALIGDHLPERKKESNDKDYVFIHFILTQLPIGLVGLLLAVIFSAAMSSTASELNALACITSVDIYKRFVKPEASDAHYLKTSRMFTAMWGVIAILFATICRLFENLIQLVNIIGSLFYGTILAIFLVAFFVKFVKSKAIFIGAIVGECLILLIYYLTTIDVIQLSYLWLNFIGCSIVMLLAMIFQGLFFNKR